MTGAERTETAGIIVTGGKKFSPEEGKFYPKELMEEFKKELALRNLVLKNVFAGVFLSPDSSVTKQVDIRKEAFVFRAKYRNVPGGTTGVGNTEVLEFSVIKINGDEEHLLSKPEKVFLISKKEGGNFGIGLIAHRDSNGEIEVNTPIARERAQRTLNELKGFSFLQYQ